MRKPWRCQHCGGDFASHTPTGECPGYPARPGSAESPGLTKAGRKLAIRLAQLFEKEKMKRPERKDSDIWALVSDHLRAEGDWYGEALTGLKAESEKARGNPSGRAFRVVEAVSGDWMVLIDGVQAGEGPRDRSGASSQTWPTKAQAIAAGKSMSRGNPRGCPQCQMLMIQGVPCHETGCPEAWKSRRECKWCGSKFMPEEKGQDCCGEDCAESYRNPPKEMLTPDMEGCWYDSHRGSYIGVEVQAEAKARGWKGEEVGAEHEDYHEAWDEAENFLDSLAPEGFWVGGNENGDFGMWKVEPEENPLTRGLAHTGHMGQDVHYDGLRNRTSIRAPGVKKLMVLGTRRLRTDPLEVVGKFKRLEVKQVNPPGMTLIGRKVIKIEVHGQTITGARYGAAYGLKDGSAFVKGFFPEVPKGYVMAIEYIDESKAGRMGLSPASRPFRHGFEGMHVKARRVKGGILLKGDKCVWENR